MNASETLRHYPPKIDEPEHWARTLTACNLIGQGHHDATYVAVYRGAQRGVYGWRLRNGHLVSLDPDKSNGEMQMQIRSVGSLPRRLTNDSL